MSHAVTTLPLGLFINMDACTELRPESSLLEGKSIHVYGHKTPVTDAAKDGIPKEQETAELSLQIISTKEPDHDAQVDLKDSLTLCPTSTPMNENNENRTYSNTPQTSPPRPTPIKSTLSETELASISHTGCVVSSLSANFIPGSISESLPLVSEDTIMLHNIMPTEKSLEFNTVIETEQTLKGSPQGLMSPVKLPLHDSCFQNGTTSCQETGPISRKPSLKRTHAEIENDSSYAVIPSPKKSETAAETMRDTRHSKVLRPFRPPKFVKGNIASGSATTQSSPRTPLVSLPGSSSQSEPKKSSSNNLTPSNKLHPQIRHTIAVSKPFKSPFKSPLSSLSTVTNKSTSSPNIRSLEKKAVMLKRATKIVAEKEDEKLRNLINKWRLAGREVAWELWSVMKDRSPEDATVWGDDKRDRFNNNWSWSTKRNWGFDERSEGCADDDEENSRDCSTPSPYEAEMWNTINIKNTMKRQETEAENGGSLPHTLGTMLRSYNITDDILGWNNEEEDFNPLA